VTSYRTIGFRGLVVCLAAQSVAGVGLAAQVLSDDAMDEAIRVPISLSRLTGPIRLDGVVDEPAWDAIEPLRMTMFSPTFGAPLTERTEVRVGYDDNYVYVSGRLYDSEPDGWRTNTLYRDQYSGDDLLAVIFDSFNDYETAVWFVTNPAGARQDRTVSNDAEFSGGSAMNADWNSHWDVETTQDDRGWYAEFRIPFSTLGFQAVDDRVTMGMILYRFIARKNERQLFPAIDPKWGGLAFAKPSRAQRVTLDGVESSTPIYVTPYSLAGFDQAPTLQSSDAGSPLWRTERDPTTEAGLDIKYSPTSNLALDVTVNTDFAQVEADDQQINLTRFPLFFPEKRQFFQERASTFDFNTGGFTNRLFHSRQIGLNDGGIVRILGGGRAVGRAGGTDFGFLSMQTGSAEGRPSENMGVVRVRQQTFNQFSTVGAMVTSRLGDNGEDNVAYGLDTTVRPFGDEYIIAKWAQTFDEAIDEGGAFDSGLLLARWERRKDGGLSYAAEFGRVGVDYLPRLGFQLRRNFRSVSGDVQYKWFQDADSRFRSFSLRANSRHLYRTTDGVAETREWSGDMELETKQGTQFTLAGTSSFEAVDEAFSVADAVVLPGEYWFHEVRLRTMLPRNMMFRGDYGVSAGTFFDGTRVGFSVNPIWNVSTHVELGGGYEVNRFDFDDRDEQTTSHLAQLRAQFALDTSFSVSTLAQYNSVADLTSLNLRLRYHFRRHGSVDRLQRGSQHRPRPHERGPPPSAVGGPQPHGQVLPHAGVVS